MIDINSIKASLNALLITFSLLKFTSKGSEISKSFILNVLALDVEIEIILIIRTIEKKKYIKFVQIT